MIQLMGYSTTMWINPTSLPVYGGSGNIYWAAMQNNSDTYLYYEHRSTLGPSGIANTLYVPIPSSNSTYTRTLNIQNLALCSTGTTTFTATWYLPEQFSRTSFPTVGSPVPPFHTSSTTLTSPGFRYDILLKISRTCS